MDAGGALFINEGATVTISNVDLSGNEAKGGVASNIHLSFGGGSGGAGKLRVAMTRQARAALAARPMAATAGRCSQRSS
ncbi:hypothetical protein A4R28_30525 (plasmid) [Mesorhizobium ciceri]|nr:hypothetical protein A4R28_30525 [Mesorhizobium ciceri]